MEAHSPSAEHDLFAAATQKFARTCLWLRAAEQSSAGHDVVEAHLLVDVREMGRLLMQAHLDLRTEREKPLRTTLRGSHLTLKMAMTSSPRNRRRLMR